MSHAAGDGLNRAQRTAVTTLSGPLLVLAGAGTGKTRVITFRIAELIKDGITPHRILAVTFTNKAAREMRQRAMALLGRRKKKGQKGPEISTFHSLCVRILRRHAKKLGYPENFTIYDRGDQESVARGALRDIRVGAQKLKPSDLINLISSWKGQSLSPAEARERARDDLELLAAEAFEKYQASLKISGAMDFDDLLSNTERLFVDHPEARFAEASRYDHLLIDEYQDTSGLQYRIVVALAERHRNLCVVGDDDQSIYGWRGAEVEHILGFRDQWPDARVVRLEENYRSTGWVIHLANTLIRHNSVRHDKVLRPAREQGDPPRFVPFDDENNEAESIVSEIFHKIDHRNSERIPASHIAILFRTNEQPRAFEQEMRRAGVPYRIVGGQSFYDRKEIKDLLSYMRVIANPVDEVSLLRIINTPPRGIGNSTIQVMVDDAVKRGRPLWEVLPLADEYPELSVAAARAVEDFRARLGSEKLSDLVGEMIVRFDYKTEIERQYKEPSEQEARMNAVQELINAVASYEEREDSPSLLGFLEESTLSDREDDKDEDGRQEHAVTLMTLHSAKGLEFPEVYLVGMEEGLLPHKRSLLEDVSTIPEERRLAYVGVTRAQTKLTLSFCKQRHKWGKLRAQIPSRFLMEMRGDSEKAKAIAAQSEEHFARDKERFEAKEAEKEEKAKKAQSKKRKGANKRLPPIELKSKSRTSEKKRAAKTTETPRSLTAEAPRPEPQPEPKAVQRSVTAEAPRPEPQPERKAVQRSVTAEAPRSEPEAEQRLAAGVASPTKEVPKRTAPPTRPSQTNKKTSSDYRQVSLFGD